MKIEICLPIKNEASILSANLNELKDFLVDNKEDSFRERTRVSLMVNGSLDDSFKIAQTYANKFPHLFSCSYIKESGKARAIKASWDKSEADILVFMDADFVVPLSYLTSIIKPLQTNDTDIVIASRYLAQSQLKRSFFKVFISQTYISLSQKILGLNHSDFQCGFKAIKKEAYHKLRPQLQDDNYFFDTELLLFARHHNLRVKEVPVTWQEHSNKVRKTKIKPISDSFIFIKNLFKLKRRYRDLAKG